MEIKLGDEFTRLTVICKLKERLPNGSVQYLCKCKCGNYKKVESSHLKDKSTKSCGCFNKEKGKLCARWLRPQLSFYLDSKEY